MATLDQPPGPGKHSQEAQGATEDSEQPVLPGPEAPVPEGNRAGRGTPVQDPAASRGADRHRPCIGVSPSSPTFLLSPHHQPRRGPGLREGE